MSAIDPLKPLRELVEDWRKPLPLAKGGCLSEYERGGDSAFAICAGELSALLPALTEHIQFLSERASGRLAPCEVQAAVEAEREAIVSVCDYAIAMEKSELEKRDPDDETGSENWWTHAAASDALVALREIIRSRGSSDALKEAVENAVARAFGRFHHLLEHPDELVLVPVSEDSSYENDAAVVVRDMLAAARLEGK